MRKNGLRTTVCCLSLLGGLIGVSCGSDSSDEANGNETEALFSENSKVKVASLAALPNVGSLMISEESTGLLGLQANSSDAVVGTPPNFADIDGESVNEFLLPDINGLIANIQSAVQSNDWDAFDTEMQKFRDGQTKCYVMQDAARQIGELASSASSSCYMKAVDPEEGSRIIEHVSGAELPQGSFFTPTAETQYRALKLTGMRDNDSEGENEVSLQEGEDRTILFELQGTSVEAGVYQVSLNFCAADGTLESREVIRVDNNQGILTISMDRNQEDDKGTVKLTAGLTENEAGEVIFDSSVARILEIAESENFEGGTHQYSGSIEIADSKLTTRMTFSGQDNQNGHSWNDKSASVVRYSGSDMSNIKIFEAAGKKDYNWSNGTDTFDSDESIVFEFNENENPKYTTISSSELSTQLDSIDFSTDSILNADLSAIAPNLEANPCSQTPSSVYSLNMASDAIAEVEVSCENYFEGGDSICWSIQDKEAEVWDAVNSYQQANPE